MYINKFEKKKKKSFCKALGSGCWADDVDDDDDDGWANIFLFLENGS